MPSSSRPRTAPAAPASPSGVKEIDAAFEAAGLVRNLRGKAAGVTRRVRLARAAPEELSSPAPVPTTAANGVQILRVANWDRASWNKQGSGKTDWLWHGFSTRKGGLSRAYC